MGFPIAGRWFERRRISDDITLFWEPHVIELMRCNIWHVRGRDRDLVVDTGMGVASLVDAMDDLLDKPVTAVATHGHGDHVGGHHEFVTALPTGMTLESFRQRPAKVSRRVVEGDAIDLGDRQFEVLHLPGHSPGSIGSWEGATGTLFSGDAIYDGPLLDELADSNIVDYCATMQRLLELPVEVVHGGHDPSFDRHTLRRIASDYLRRRA